MAIILALIAVVLLVVLAMAWTAMGVRPDGERQARIEKSPVWDGEKFENPQPMKMDYWGSFTAFLDISPVVTPTEPPPAVRVDPKMFATPPPTGLRVTWLGHSSILVELDGHRVLTDPVWSERAGPLSWIGPSRYFPPALALEDLPPLNAVLISHDHYDHLDYATIRALRDRDVKFIVPLGVGAHLASWSVPAKNIVELDWWEKAIVGEMEIHAVPARHASGRNVIGMNLTLWAGYAMIGKAHRAYYSGDTALFPAMKEIGDRLGPFDVTMIEVGQYHQAWPDWHIGPEQAVLAHQWVRGKVMIPVHWGLFTLAMHGWTEPIERTLAAGKDATVLVPKPGQSVEPELPPPFEKWWPDVAWRTGAEDPIVSTKIQ